MKSSFQASIQKPRERSVDIVNLSKDDKNDKNILKSSKSVSKLLKAHTVKFSDGLVPIRQSKHYINNIRNYGTKDINKFTSPRISVDISNPYVGFSDKKPGVSLSDLKAKKLKKNEPIYKKMITKTKKITLDIDSKDLIKVTTEHERGLSGLNWSKEILVKEDGNC